VANSLYALIFIGYPSDDGVSTIVDGDGTDGTCTDLFRLQTNVWTHEDSQFPKKTVGILKEKIKEI